MVGRPLINREAEKKEGNTHLMAEHRRVSAYQGVEKKMGHHANTRPAGHEKGDREVLSPRCLVLTADPGSIPCKCKPTRPCLMHPRPAESCGSLDHPERFPHSHTRLRICQPPKNGPKHAAVDCASGQVIVGRRQKPWQIHTVVKQPQDIDV
jgi:hypothetical protein